MGLHHDAQDETDALDGLFPNEDRTIIIMGEISGAGREILCDRPWPLASIACKSECWRSFSKMPHPIISVVRTSGATCDVNLGSVGLVWVWFQAASLRFCERRYSSVFRSILSRCSRSPGRSKFSGSKRFLSVWC